MGSQRVTTPLEKLAACIAALLGSFMLARLIGLVPATPHWLQSRPLTDIALGLFWMVWAATLYERARANRDGDTFKPSALKKMAAVMFLLAAAIVVFAGTDLIKGA